MISTIGCGHSDHQIDLFFNPARAVDFDHILLKIKIGDQIIVDTLVENPHVDNSLFIQSYRYSPEKKGMLSVEINGKKKDIVQIHSLLKCASVFLRYDDHSLIFEEVGRIETERSSNLTTPDFRRLIDSIKSSTGSKYHQITFNIKDGDCSSR